MILPINQHLIEKGEEVADKLLRSCRKIIPTLARLCLVMTYIEDGTRLYMDQTVQQSFLEYKWNLNYYFVKSLLFYSIVVQLVASAIILFRCRVSVGCCMLLSIVILQCILYDPEINLSLFSWLSPVLGGLMLIWAESRNDSRRMFASLPTMYEGTRGKNLLQFGGRTLVVLMFISILDFSFKSWFTLIQVPVAIVLMFLVTIGYKTKLSALLLVVWLNGFNFYHNAWWTMDPTFHFYRTRLRIQFFTMISVIGGLLMVIYLGPGGVSVDNYKKSW